MAAVVVTELTFAITAEDAVTSTGLGPAAPGGPRHRSQVGGTRPIYRTHGTITIPSSASTYATGGIPITGILGLTDSGAGPLGGTRTYGLVAGNGFACPGLGCPNELTDLIVEGEDETTSHLVAFIRGVAGTTPHRLRLFQDNAAAGAKPLTEVANATALSDATAFPGAPTIINVTAYGW